MHFKKLYIAVICMTAAALSACSVRNGQDVPADADIKADTGAVHSETVRSEPAVSSEGSHSPTESVYSSEDEESTDSPTEEESVPVSDTGPGTEESEELPVITEAYITTEPMLMEISPGVYDYGDVVFYYLHVAGNFAYYEVMLSGELSRQYDGTILLTAGADLQVACDITPYFEDGTAGETVHCSQNG